MRGSHKAFECLIKPNISKWVKCISKFQIFHCYHVNDFPLINGTPGIIQDPIDLLLANCTLMLAIIGI